MKSALIIGAGVVGGLYYAHITGGLSEGVTREQDQKTKLVFVAMVVLSIVVAYKVK